MSHFTVVVLLPRLKESAMNAEIERLLEPYNENQEVDEYARPCWCMNREAGKRGRNMADKLVGTWESRRDAFSASEAGKSIHPRLKAAIEAGNWDMHETLNNEAQTLYRAFNAEFDQSWETTKRDYTETSPDYGKANADCEECNGTGIDMSTYNPQSKWDWYRVGGRFDGSMTDNRQQSENGFNFDAKHETLANNSIPVAELVQAAEPFIPYALVTPDGEWIERGQMGWWGMSSGDKDRSEWNAQVMGIYEKFSEFDAVLLDCHI